jgi:pullulanase
MTVQDVLPCPDAKLTLGSFIQGDKTIFRLWSPVSSSAELLLYSQYDAETPVEVYKMKFNRENGVWESVIERNLDGWFYEYRLVHTKGTVQVLDPYAKSMAAYHGYGNGRAAVIDLESSKAQPDNGWEDLTAAELHHPVDAVIYEISVRDFTISKDSRVHEKPGTYLAFIEKLDYLKDLGVTHIQLMPVLNFYFTDETRQEYENSGTSRGNNYNWGYDPHHYFTPEGWLCSDPADPYSRIRELKQLIKEIHRRNMGVLLDVVYNHMGNPEVLDDIVPGYYFRLDSEGNFTSNSGCGNDIASTRTMARRLIIDSVTYLAKEFYVDGFRFDLMGLMDTETILKARESAMKASNRSDLLFEGEGWAMYNGPEGTRGMDQSFMAHTKEVAVFNDEVRDLLKAGGMNEEARGLITQAAIDKHALFQNLIGKPKQRYTAASPQNSMVYVAAHDGLTLHDTISHNMHLNPQYPWEKEEIYARLKCANLLILTSQSIPFLHGGQERGRTKPKLNSDSEILGNFVRNSYDSSDSINQFIWDLDRNQRDLLKYTKNLIAIRKEFGIFRQGSFRLIDKSARFIETESPLLFAYLLLHENQAFILGVNTDKFKHGFSIDAPWSSATVLADREKADPKGFVDSSSVTILQKQERMEIEAITPFIVRIEFSKTDD